MDMPRHHQAGFFILDRQRKTGRPNMLGRLTTPIRGCEITVSVRRSVKQENIEVRRDCIPLDLKLGLAEIERPVVELGLPRRPVNRQSHASSTNDVALVFHVSPLERGNKLPITLLEDEI